MSSLRKYHIPKSVILVTTSIEVGLLLLPTPVVETIIWSALARAYALYPVKICAFVIMGNHIHFIFYIEIPENIRGFMERFKTEVSHCINRLLGRRQRTVWMKSYDSPIILDQARVEKAIAYINANPAKANLVDSIDEYPGLSSWRMIKQKRLERDCPWIHRTDVGRFGIGMTSQSHLIAFRMRDQAEESHIFKIEPNAWMKAFRITEQSEIDEVNERIVERTRLLEEEARELRIKQRRKVMGAHKLVTQRPNLHYKSKRRGRCSSCISTDRKLKMKFQVVLADYAETAKRVYHNWLEGDFTEEFPKGLYPPAKPKDGNLPALYELDSY